MDIEDEINYSRRLIEEARKLNPEMGYFFELTSKPFSAKIMVKLTNGTAFINSMILQEYRRKREKLPATYIEEIACSFEKNED